MDMLYTDIANSPWMFIWVAIVIALAFVQCLIYMRRAWSRALALGLEKKQIRKGVTTGVTVSIIPTLPVLIVLLSLMPLLGTPLPWLRLSVIGSAMYESAAATVGINSVGEEMVMGGYSAYAWIAAAWTMTFGASMCMVWSSVAVKPISLIYDQIEKFDIGLVLAVGAGCMAGIMAYASTINGFSAMSTKGIIFLSSFVCSALLVVLHKKLPKLRWLKDFNMAFSMLFGMVLACIIF